MFRGRLKQKRRNCAPASGRTPEALPGRARRGRPAAPPPLFTLAGRSSLCCAACEARVTVGVPSGVWGRRARRCAAPGGRRGVRSQENVNFIPGRPGGTLAQWGRGPRWARAAAPRHSASFVPAVLRGRRAGVSSSLWASSVQVADNSFAA